MQVNKKDQPEANCKQIPWACIDPLKFYEDNEGEPVIHLCVTGDLSVTNWILSYSVFSAIHLINASAIHKTVI